ncbi:MAG: molybdate ABC transporter permease subunit [Myxococcales bacterium]|nr:molybdate ABC transporter permease subunit [Myxococcales bacterium]
MDASALRLSLELAALTTVGLLVLGIPLAQWLATTAFRGKVIAETIVSMPLVLPPTVLGYYLLVAFGNRSPLGQAWIRLTGHPLAFSFAGLLVASLLYSLPFAVQPFAASLSRVDKRLVEASWSLGVSRLATFFEITLPLAAPGIVAGAVLTFAHTLGEFGVVLMVGGNLPGETRTLSIAIFDSVEKLDYASANATALFLLVVSFAVLLVTHVLRQSVWTTRS